MSTVNIRVASAFAIGLAVGGGTAYFLTKQKFQAIVDADIAAMREEYERKEAELQEYWKVPIRVDSKEPVEKELTPEEQIERGYSEKLADLGYAEKSDLETEGLPSRFDLIDPKEMDPEDYERSEDDPALWDRDFEKPYVINVTEWNTEHLDDPKWEKIKLSYYRADDVLCPEDGQSVDIDYNVGEHNLAHFGVGSEDPKFLYIRNENIDTDFEIELFEDSYSKLVLGIHEWNAEDIQEKKPKVKKMRSDG